MGSQDAGGLSCGRRLAGSEKVKLEKLKLMLFNDPRGVIST
jgi:hypothetical protein